ncbi:PD-(D/E)XK nuclease family protein [Enterococcus columbae]|uniref:Helicase-exonuclease AddAB, AddB subunit n=1 Tax=Enterococcus columbae DSM 7374 = ATCC 51263 TaxID=1121865 RepID=S0KWG1_9ENTE|nr:PD-(D/E)XK nuclease family protein [Enterococcus columbae]EOT44443.1 helicase-exonuclease AddAB, AddB subunit [Enterococcus columbae DSM 7374 = ATCC 51263]EOW84601.1 helicase-exonuclease AddAB, AddB subunit [Enterococcus columbae DSM 7374 = ATCC 51263]OJG21439.1 helicase-exonuclease AddAB, AddB subunit [Enterococcus columbae DSM 7374 = ATCC 51263]
MPLQFHYGLGSVNHLPHLLNEARNWLNDKSRQVIFIVPNYNKFERELEILKNYQKLEQSESFSSFQLQIFSFQRLSWFYLQNLPLAFHQPLNPVGKEMILRQVLLEQKENLQMYRGEIEQRGFIQQLLDLFHELETGQLTLEQLLAKTQENIAQNTDLTTKLHELTLIYQAFNDKMVALAYPNQSVHQQFLEVLTLLNQVDTSDVLFDYYKTELKNRLANTLFIVTGFSEFSGEEYQILTQLIQQSNVAIDIILDNPKKSYAPLDVFYPSSQTYQKLLSIAKENKLPVYLDKKIKSEENTWLPFIERIWLDEKEQLVGKEQQQLSEHLHLWKIENPQEELRKTAVTIKQLLMKQPDLRLRDIQLLLPDMDRYRPYIQYVFNEAELPFYLDTPKQMLNHPLVDLLKNLFAFKKYYFKSNDVMHFFKTELFIPKGLFDLPEDDELYREQFRRQVDVLENVVLSYQFQGSDWAIDTDWELIYTDTLRDKDEALKMKESQMNQLRQAFYNHVVCFIQAINQVTTFGEMIERLYDWLVSSGVENELKYWRDQAIQENDLTKARLHEQTWQAMMDIFDQFHELYALEKFDFSLFEAILFSAIENYQFSQLPSTIDQIQINRLELVRPRQAKVSFILGLTEGAFPRKFDNHSLFSNEDRLILQTVLKAGQELKQATTFQSLKENFIAYSAFLSASEQLYLSYPLNIDDKQNFKASPYLTRLTKQAQLHFELQQSLQADSTPDNYLVSMRGLIRQLTLLKRLTQDEKQALSPQWLLLEQELMQSSEAQLARQIFTSLAHKNEASELAPQLAEQLYGKELYSSISSLETFYQCQYRYFLNYGLRLRERERLRLDAALTGTYFHDALERVIQYVIDQQIDFHELADQQRQEIIEQIFIELLTEPRYRLLSRSKRMAFIRQQLEKTLSQMFWVIQHQSNRTKLAPQFTEILFGSLAGEKGIDSIDISLADNHQIHLRGKIDRLDLFQHEDQYFLSVIDYKSGNKQFDLTDFYAGLAMQLITYLDVAIKYVATSFSHDEKKVIPLGAYYLHVYRPNLNRTDSMEDIIKKYRYSGLFLDEHQYFDIMDPTLSEKQQSLVFPVQVNKDGNYTKKPRNENRFYTQDEIKALIKINEENMRKAGETLYQGKLKINPYYKATSEVRACSTCPFRSVCQFDVLLKENQYRRIEKIDKQTLFNKGGE